MQVAAIQEELNIKAEGLAKEFIAYAIDNSEVAATMGEKEAKALLAETTAFIFHKLKDKLVKDSSISIDTPIKGVLPVSKDNIEVVSFVRDKIIGGVEFSADVKESTRVAREYALSVRGDLKNELVNDIAEVMKTRRVSGEKAPEYQKRYDENKCVLELFGLNAIKLQELKDKYAHAHGGASVRNGQAFADLVDNAVFHIREGKVDVTSLRVIGLEDSQIEGIAGKLSEKIQTIASTKETSGLNSGGAESDGPLENKQHRFKPRPSHLAGLMQEGDKETGIAM